MKIAHIIVSENAFNHADPDTIVQSNISVVNLLREEGVDDDNLPEDAMTSYYLDYYLSQNNNGGFAQFVWNANWSQALNVMVKKGLEQIGAEKHLAYFIQQSKVVESLPKEELDVFLEREYFGENPTRDQLKNDSFFELNESITELNAKWLRNHPQLKVLSVDDMYAELEKLVGHSIDK